MKKILFIILFLFLFINSYSVEINQYYLLHVNGIIDTANADYIIKGIERAEKNSISGVIIVLDTPGGLMKSMRKIVNKILNSKIPVITYVYPEGSRAASAGTFILLASHIAVMSPGTNIGTAHPVDYAGKSVKEKIVNDSIAYIKNLARLKNRNQKWAEETITKNISSSEKQALKNNVIDFIAKDINELMEKLDGTKIKIGNKNVILKTKNYKLITIEPSFKHKFLHYLADPNISYVLFLIGIYGIIYELAHPGVLLPGIAGAISLMLALIGFESLPINIAGIFLIILAILFFILEALTPTFGALTLGGVISMIIGSILLFPTRDNMGVWAPSYWVIGIMVVLTLLIVGVVLVAIIKAQRKKKVTGKESLIGLKGVAVTEISDKGVVNIGGEDWQAFSDEKINEREVIEVLEVSGMRLKVKKIPRKKEE